MLTYLSDYEGVLFFLVLFTPDSITSEYLKKLKWPEYDTHSMYIYMQCTFKLLVMYNHTLVCLRSFSN